MLCLGGWKRGSPTFKIQKLSETQHMERRDTYLVNILEYGSKGKKGTQHGSIHKQCPCSTKMITYESLGIKLLL